MEKYLFSELHIDSSFDIDVSTVNRFCQAVLSARDVSYPRLTNTGAIFEVNKILNAQRDNLKALHKADYSYKYSSEITKTIAQLKSSQVEAESLLYFRHQNTQLQNKINDLGLILREYEVSKAVYLDANDVITSAVMNISDTQYADDYFMFVGYDDFTFQAYSLISRLISASAGVYVTLYENTDGHNAHIYPSQVRDRLTGICLKKGYAIDNVPSQWRESGLHAFLQDHLFSQNALGYCLDDHGISLYSADAFDDEIEFVARHIRYAVLNGARYSDFGICVYGLEQYENIIKRTLNKYEINHYIDTKHSIRHTELARFVSAFLDYQIAPNDDNVITLVNSAYSPFDNLQKSVIIRDIEYYGHDKCTLPEYVEYMDRLGTFAVPKSATAPQIRDVIHALIEHFAVADINATISGALDDLYDQKVIENCLDSVLALLDEIVLHYPSCDVREFADVFTNALAEVYISPLPQSMDTVQVVEASENLTKFRKLFIMNCTNATCPKVIQDCGVILDKDISALDKCAEISPSIMHINKLNKFQMLNSVQMFESTLCITMSMSSEVEKSELVTELEKRISIHTADGDEIGLTRLSPSLIDSDIYEPLSRVDLAENIYAKNYDSTTFDDAVHILPVRDIDDITADNVDIMFRHGQISSSQIENYFKCPFVHFVKNGLKIKENDQKYIKKSEIGTIIHSMVEQYYTRKIAPADIEAFVDAYVDRHYHKPNTKANKQICISVKKECVRLLRRLSQNDRQSLFVPTYFELNFDRNKSDFFAYPLGDYDLKGKVDRVDISDEYFRVIDFKTGDEKPDYKDIYFGTKIQLFLYGMALQKCLKKSCAGVFYLPISQKYLKDEKNTYKLNGFFITENDMVHRLDVTLEPEVKNASDIVNVKIKKDGSVYKNNYALTSVEMEQIFAYVDALSTTAIREIQSGNIYPSPIAVQGDVCQYCDFLPICRRNSFNIQHRKSGAIKKEDIVGEGDE